LQPPVAPMTQPPPQPLPMNPRLPQQQRPMDQQQSMREAVVMHLLQQKQTASAGTSTQGVGVNDIQAQNMGMGAKEASGSIAALLNPATLATGAHSLFKKTFPSIFQTSPAPTMPTQGPQPATPTFKAAGINKYDPEDLYDRYELQAQLGLNPKVPGMLDDFKEWWKSRKTRHQDFSDREVTVDQYRRMLNKHMLESMNATYADQAPAPWTTDDHSNIEGPGLHAAPPMSVLTSGVSSEKPSKRSTHGTAPTLVPAPTMPTAGPVLLSASLDCPNTRMAEDDWNGWKKLTDAFSGQGGTAPARFRRG
jgi:hypothetical protein